MLIATVALVLNASQLLEISRLSTSRDNAQCKPLNPEITLGWGDPLDLACCRKENRLGLRVVDRQGQNCLVKMMSEMEGAFSVYTCLLPISTGSVIPSKFFDYYLVHNLKYCKVTESGNMLRGDPYPRL